MGVRLRWRFNCLRTPPPPGPRLRPAGLECSNLLRLKRVPNKQQGVTQLKGDALLSRQSGGMCVDFNPMERILYIVGTEDGTIHKCSTSYSEQYLETYAGHAGVQLWGVGRHSKGVGAALAGCWGGPGMDLGRGGRSSWHMPHAGPCNAHCADWCHDFPILSALTPLLNPLTRIPLGLSPRGEGPSPFPIL